MSGEVVMSNDRCRLPIFEMLALDENKDAVTYAEIRISSNVVNNLIILKSFNRLFKD